MYIIIQYGWFITKKKKKDKCELNKWQMTRFHQIAHFLKKHMLTQWAKIKEKIETHSTGLVRINSDHNLAIVYCVGNLGVSYGQCYIFNGHLHMHRKV